jgi:hypothetical protein
MAPLKAEMEVGLGSLGDGTSNVMEQHLLDTNAGKELP